MPPKSVVLTQEEKFDEIEIWVEYLTIFRAQIKLQNFCFAIYNNNNRRK